MSDHSFPIGDRPGGAWGEAGGGTGSGPISLWRRDLPAELEELHARVARVVDDRTTEARKLSMMVMGISNVLVDLRILPIQDIAQLPKMAQEVLAAVGLILEHLRE
jgi:hypothetical protein